MKVNNNREKAVLKLDEIVLFLSKNIQNNSLKWDDGLYTGTFGILMFFAYYSRFTNKHQISYDQSLENSLEIISNGVYKHTYCSGLSGILYSIEHLNINGFVDIDLTEVNNEYYSLLSNRMFFDVQNCNYDFMHGALGVGLYMQKCDLNFSRNNLLYLIKFLENYGIKENGTIKWESYNPIKMNKWINISISHGISSIIVFLCRMLKIDIVNDKISTLIVSAISYILSQEIDVNKYGSYFPYTSIESEAEDVSKSRMAWCYGDLGVASAIWQAGKALNNQQWKDKAIEVFRYATTRTDLDSNLVRDAGICHGTAGIAQIFKRMYVETGIEDFKIANEYWIGETLKMAKFDDGAAGYKAYHGVDDGEWKVEYNFLEGVAGIGLSLISYLSDNHEDSAWDEILLLS